ncbi:lectin L6-like [Littorina saxatilis]|uniref:lectin L6-like n=1 Tax=Littorina saxatilis TaxID=31220 RepID=UPI0038B65390
MVRQSALCSVLVLAATFLTLTHAVTFEEPEGRLVSVSVGPSGVWGASANNTVFYREQSFRYPTRRGSDWIKIPGDLKQVDVGTNIVWGVNSADDIYYRIGCTQKNPSGVAWVQVEGALKHVSVSPWGSVWGVNSNGDINYREGASLCDPAGIDWLKVSGSLSQISAGYAGVWGVNARNDVFYRTGTCCDTGAMGDDWIKVDNKKLKYVSSGDGQVLALDKWGKIFRREGVSSSNPIGTAWRIVDPKKLMAIDSYGVIFWGVDDTDKIFLATM